MLEKEYELRYSDFDGKGNIKICRVFDILQDVSVMHADKVGMSEGLKKESLACFLNGWRVRFEGYLSKDMPIIVKTGIVSVGKLDSSRKYEIWQNGECKVIATSAWVIVDINRGRIVRTPIEFFELFEKTDEEDNNLPVVRATAAKELSSVGEYTIRRIDIDTNSHLNNVSAIEILSEYIPEDAEISEITVRYRKQVRFGERVEILCGKTENGDCLLLKDSNDDSCVVINFKNTEV